MVLGYTDEEILRAAVEGHSDMLNGVAAYDYDTGELCSCGYTTGESEHPDNHLIEIYRLHNGERGELDCHCWENGDCPFWIHDEDRIIGGYFDEDMVDEYGDRRIDCCIDGVAADLDLETDDLTGLVRSILKDHLGETIEKLNDIRLALLDITEPHHYIENRMEDWCYNVLDVYVDYAMDDGFTIKGDPQAYLESEVTQIENIALYGLDYGPVPDAKKIIERIRSCDLDGALKLLQ